jgi:hypothetical protein
MILKKPKNIVSSIFFQILFLMTFITTTTIANAIPLAPPISSPVRVEIIDDRGRIFRQIQTGSKGYKIKRAYVQAKKGKHYSLRLRNISNRRVGIVIAVDGRNILTGKKSWLGKHEKMYILNAYETGTYKGWRTNKNRVNRFFFTASNNSYATAWQDKSAIGVIALAVFNEEPQIMHHHNNNSLHNNKARRAPSAASSALTDEAGTGFGREEYSPTIKVRFKPQYRPVEKHFYKYEWRSSLCKRGIIQCYDRPPTPHNRFWPSEDYAPYPPGMNRDDYRNHSHEQNPLFDY